MMKYGIVEFPGGESPGFRFIMWLDYSKACQQFQPCRHFFRRDARELGHSLFASAWIYQQSENRGAIDFPEYNTRVQEGRFQQHLRPVPAQKGETRQLIASVGFKAAIPKLEIAAGRNDLREHLSIEAYRVVD